MRRASEQTEVLALLGLARRAGAVATGTQAVRRALQHGEARLVLLATDGSAAQQNKVVPLADGQEVPWRVLGTRAELGAALGCGPLTAVAVTRRRFARELESRLGQD